MNLRQFLFAVALLCTPVLAQAQDFGVMESAETIDKGNFKLKINPMFLLGDGDDEVGLAGGVGYGFTPRLDGEVQVAGYDGLVFVGGNLEYWLVKHPSVDVSAILGAHYGNTEGVDQAGVDVTVIASHAATRRLDIFGALDLAFNKFRNNARDNGFKQVLLVPGVEYKLHRDLELLGEVGIALNDDARNYLSVGLAYYIR